MFLHCHEGFSASCFTEEHHGSLSRLRHGRSLSRRDVPSLRATSLPPLPVPTTDPTPLEPPIASGLAPRLHLTQEDIRRLRFKPTVGRIRLSEGTPVTVNCSIDIDDILLDLSIQWWKNNAELNMQAVVNDLQTESHGVSTLLSTLRYQKLIIFLGGVC